ncbi:protein of unknown function DUF71 [Gottschalkia purinilytica]|uniref:Diphthamide synthase domain-containing protein n=1 Tax=Gottschalkia purinilytica TaxID=1503 RepID=A0A0L0WB06_GOTPU|nr:diphthine--ammonia ligase [Gottschalkia purinilytica]KNF08678.1 protein of unknown function DUF71 [Gottschalkia purinilytica]
MENINFFCSWSGGKDSCLSLYRAIKDGGIPKLLFTVFRGDGERSRSHGLDRSIIEAQSKSLGIPFEIRTADWGKYEGIFLDFLKEISIDGIQAGVFGDIDLQSHRDWVEAVCKKANVKPYLPLWKEQRESLVKEFVDLGFESVIVAVKSEIMGKEYLGRIIDHDLIKELKEKNIDPSGEGGEFHTVVIDGPIFDHKVELDFKEKIEVDKYCFLDVALK